MKKLSILLSFLLIACIGIAQVPQAFKYQAVVRDTLGFPVVNQLVGVEIGLLQGSTTGTLVYDETHAVLTNAVGLINLEIGQGLVQQGSFEAIDWSAGPYFIQVAVDLQGGANYQVIGTSQLLSVPFAMFAESSGDAFDGIPAFTQSEIDTMAAVSGDLVYNSSTSCLNYYNGIAWMSYCGEQLCTPLPTVADAGPDTILLTNSMTLQGNTPVVGTGQWSIVAGPGGNFTDSSSPNSGFNGYFNQNYILEWTISTNCGSSSDWVAVNFINCDDYNPCTVDLYDPITGCYHEISYPTPAIAGPDQDVYGDSTQLAANTPLDGQGSWVIVSGLNGSINNIFNPQSVFHGVSNQTYQLAWLTSNCGYTSSDTVSIHFFNCDDNNPCTDDWFDTQNNMCYHDSIQVTIANAGNDQNAFGDSTTLEANLPLIGSGQWQVVSGNNGVFTDVNNPVSGFSGLNNTTYTLVWQISDTFLCDVSTDTVLISFFNCDDGNECTADFYDPVNGCYHEPVQITQAYVGNGTLSTFGDSVMLTGNTPAEFEIGTWSVFGSDTTGTFSDIHDPNAIFFGDFGVPYVLNWTISSSCGSSSDLLIVTLSDCNDYDPCTFDYIDSLNICHHDTLEMVVADAGPDQLHITGTQVFLNANMPVNGTGLWTLIDGTNGSITNPGSPSTLFTGQAGNTYTLVWSIVHECQNTYDTMIVNFMGIGEIVCGIDYTDPRDNQVYPTVQINDQCWMGKNLNFGDQIQSSLAQSNNGIAEKYCYNNLTSNCDTYGGLYSWNEIMNYTNTEGSEGLCPSGWRVATDWDWFVMESFLDSSITSQGIGLYGDSIKQLLLPGGSSNMNLLLGGYFSSNDQLFKLQSSQGYFWTSSEYSLSYSYHRHLSGSGSGIFRDGFNKNDNLSVRCVKTDTPPCFPGPDQADAGEDQFDLVGTSVQLQANTPVNGQGIWTVTNGQGGSFVSDTSATTNFSGTPGVVYTLLWTISNNCGESADSVNISFFDPTTFQCGNNITDLRDNQAYQTIDVGNGQCWFKENLNYGSMITASVAQTNNSIPEKYCYNNDTAQCDQYGGLYTWDEMMNYTSNEGSQGLCPEGWRVATDNDWYMLESYLDSSINDPSTTFFRGDSIVSRIQVGGNSGFELQKAGYHYNGYFQSIGTAGHYWTSSEAGSTSGWERFFNPGAFTGMSRNGNNKQNYKFSVRCIKAEATTCSPQPSQADAGPDQMISGDTITTLAANTPQFGSGTWSILQGSDGVIQTPTNPISTFIGSLGNAYTLIWTISTGCGSNADTVQITFVDTSSVSFNCGSIFLDTRDNQAYPTGSFGDQCWMLKNLNYGNFVQSSVIQSDNQIAEKYCFNNTAANCDQYGALYSWDEMMDYNTGESGKGLCPEGWHVPSDEEWFILTSTLDSTITDPNATGFQGTTIFNTLTTGNFNALLGGYHGGGNNFYGLNTGTQFWTSSWLSFTAYKRYLDFLDPGIKREDDYPDFAFSVRCVLNNATYGCVPQPTPADAGPDQLNVIGSSTTLEANVPVDGIGSWAIVSGSNGQFVNNSLANTGFSGEAGQIYTLTWSITTNCSTSTDTVLVSFYSNAQFSCGLPFVDPRDSMVYNTATINNQCWMTSNLNYGTMINGNLLMSDNGISEKYCYNNDPANCASYGAFYTWNEMMNHFDGEASQGLCPDGWHVASNTEWFGLLNSVDPTIISPDTMGWVGSNVKPMLLTGGSSGLELELSGNWVGGVTPFYGINYSGRYWTSTSGTDPLTAHEYRLEATQSSIMHEQENKNYGFSVRCVLNDASTPCYPQPSQANAGPDVSNIIGNQITLSGNTPVYGTGSWSTLPAGQGSFNDPSLPNAVFTGSLGQSYQLVWTITTACDFTSDTVTISFATSANFTCGQDFIDIRNSKTYGTVQINNQCWMTDNLNFGTMINSSQIPTNNQIVEKYCYGNDSTNCNTYGALYKWDEMMNYQSDPLLAICPQGWRVATDNDWYILENTLDPTVNNPDAIGYRGTNIGNKLLPGGSSGMDLKLAGQLSSSYYSIEQMGLYWTSTPDTSGIYAFLRIDSIANPQISRELYNKAYGMSIRCIRDESASACYPEPTPAITGDDLLNVIGSTTVTLSANSPVYGTGTWSVISGTGGTFADASDPNTEFTGTVGQSYTLEWSISTICNTSSDQMTVSFVTAQNLQCGSSFIDGRDNKVYGTVSIGSQCWMDKNLDYGTFIPITQVQQNNSIAEKYCYNNDSTNCTDFGALYQWDELMQYSSTPGVQGLCPAGFHIATDPEWVTMTQFLDPTVVDTAGAWSGTTIASQLAGGGSSGMKIYAVGYASNSNFYGVGSSTQLWTSTPKFSNTAYKRQLNLYGGGAQPGIRKDDEYTNTNAFSVRCIK